LQNKSINLAQPYNDCALANIGFIGVSLLFKRIKSNKKSFVGLTVCPYTAAQLGGIHAACRASK